MQLFLRGSIYGKILLAICFFLMAGINNAIAAPIHFIPNYGQWENQVIARASLNSGWFWLHNTGFTYLFYDGKTVDKYHKSRNKKPLDAIDAQVIKVIFEGADFSGTPLFEQPTKQYYNFFTGSNPQNWKTGIYAYHKIYFTNVYPNIDFVLYANGDALKYDFIVKPGGDPNNIKIVYQGQNNTVMQKNGDALFKTAIASITEKAPIVYQQHSFKRKHISSGYYVKNGRLQFNIGRYDRSKELIIDPELIFSTFSGSPADNFGYTATYDEAGNGYSGGTVFAAKFPVTPGAIQLNFAGGFYDIGILKYSPDGSQLIYCTYLGGDKDEDPHSMVVNRNNELIIFGNTMSANFPFTKNAYDTTHNGASDIIIMRISPDGRQLLGSTFIGGKDFDALNGVFEGEQYSNLLAYNYADTYRGEVLADSAGYIYVATTTNSADFPAENGFQQTFGGGIQDACILKMTPDLSQLVWSTFLGGSDDDAAYSLAFNTAGEIYTCGGTISKDFPVATNKPAFANTQDTGFADGFIACISPDGQKYLYFTYFGTSAYDQCYFVQADKDENIFATGQTAAGDKINITPGLYNNPNSGQFIIKVSPQLDSVLLSTTFGSGRNEADIAPSAFLVDKCGQVYFSGWGGKTNAPSEGGHGGFTTGLPVTDNAYQSDTDSSDFYLAVFTHDLKKLVYATFFGGSKSEEHVDGGTSRFDRKGVVYQSICAGCGGYSDLPTTENAWSRTNKGRRPNRPLVGGCNNALFKMDINTHPSFTYTIDTCTLAVSFTKDSLSSNASVWWNFGDNATSAELNPVHVYKQPGLYNVTIITNKGTDCADTVVQQVDLLNNRNKEPEIFNVITPNNDGLNEYFHIPQLDALCENYSIQVYNRWGEYMYNEEGRNLKWYGTNLKGKPATEGVYFYIVKSVVFGELKGTITVLR